LRCYRSATEVLPGCYQCRNETSGTDAEFAREGGGGGTRREWGSVEA
jgi:hypothetical protein